MALKVVVDNCEELEDIRGLGEPLQRELFVSIFSQQKLNFRLASVFKETEDDKICAVLEQLDLQAGVVSFNSAGKGCRGI